MDAQAISSESITEETPRSYEPGPLHGLPVRLEGGGTLGKVRAVYTDQEFGLTEWAAVAVGRLRRHEVLVPLVNATLHDGTLTVPYSRERVMAAPHHDPDPQLSVAEEERLFDHYGIAWTGSTVTAAEEPAEEVYEEEYDEEPAEDDGSMVRSEEQITVVTRPVAVGQARLIKRRVTEMVAVEVPVSREIVEMREGTDEEIEAEFEGEDIEYGSDVTLYADEPVVHRNVRAIERVRLNVDRVDGDEEVTDSVRREVVNLEETPAPKSHPPSRARRTS